MLLVAATLTYAPDLVRVADVGSLRAAFASARPGTEIALAPGDYRGPFLFPSVHGAAGRPIVLRSLDPTQPARVLGGIQFSGASHLEIRDLALDGPAGNVINVDDGGTITRPSHHVRLIRLHLSNAPAPGANLIKLAGVDDFEIVDSRLRGYGGCGIDMVGCHRGTIRGCRIEGGPGVGIQGKGATADVTVRDTEFVDYGVRGVNLGGSTGKPFFRPALEAVPSGFRYESKNLTVEDCVFRGGDAPVAFVGADGATVRRNRILVPNRWALRILQETAGPDFVPCRNGIFEANAVVFRSDRWFEGGVNIGPGTAPQTFVFRRNRWFCEDRPDRSRPSLPIPEVGGTYGVDPRE